MKYNYKKEVKAHLKDRFGNDVAIRFKGDDPTLIFADGASEELKKSAVSFTENLYKRMGGQVRFYPELEKVLEVQK